MEDLNNSIVYLTLIFAVLVYVAVRLGMALDRRNSGWRQSRKNDSPPN
jgi:hypothetical protein